MSILFIKPFNFDPDILPSICSQNDLKTFLRFFGLTMINTEGVFRIDNVTI